jgi:hypothetical protein
MYLPKNKYKIINVVDSSVVTRDGSTYNGSTIQTSNGQIFIGNSLEGRKTELKRVAENQDIEIQRPYNDYYGPTDKDYEKGMYVRYFTRSRSGKFSEMNKEQWLEKRNRKNLTSGQVNWLLTGPVQDGKYNGIPFKGTSTKNREALERLEKNFPGITDFFKSTSEFVR